jgi:hypothetical protein
VVILSKLLASQGLDEERPERPQSCPYINRAIRCRFATVEDLRRLSDCHAGAKHSHWNIAITPGEPSKVHYVIDTGSGTKQDGLDLARKCLSEWERILIAQGLAI